VHARLAPQVPKGPVTAHFDQRLLVRVAEARAFERGGFDNAGLPPAPTCQPLIHLDQLGRKERRLRTADAGFQLDQRRERVGRCRRGEDRDERSSGFAQAGLGVGYVGFCEVAEVGIGFRGGELKEFEERLFRRESVRVVEQRLLYTKLQVM
jgi:hypothetical protein